MLRRRPHRAVRRPVMLSVVWLVAMTLLITSAVSSDHAAATEGEGASATTSDAGFVHPGILVDLPTLDYVRDQLATGADPWTSIFETIRAGQLIRERPDWRIFSDARDKSRPCDPGSPQGCVLDCDSTTCKEVLNRQINSAYANALLWYYSGDEQHARRAVEMLNGYGQIVRGFITKKSTTYTGILEAAWTAQTLLRAAEIIRYTYDPTGDEEVFDTGAFESMVRTALVPLFSEKLLDDRAAVNNWRTSAIEALMNSGVFLNDRRLYERSLEMWRELVPSYIYLTEDGSRPRDFPGGLFRGAAAQACYWLYDRDSACARTPPALPDAAFQNGQSAEVCRDFWHASAGMGGIINAAETAHLQGDDLYGEQEPRLKAGMSYLLQIKQSFDTEGYPDGFCGDDSGSVAGRNGMELPGAPGATRTMSSVVAYNHYVTRLGGEFPTLQIPGYDNRFRGGDPVATYIATQRSGPGDTFDFVTSWQVLTHYGVGDGERSMPTPTPSPAPSDTPSAPREDSPPGSPPYLLAVAIVTLAGLLAWILHRRRADRRRRRRAATTRPLR